jgi:hypothetical protein
VAFSLEDSSVMFLLKKMDQISWIYLFFLHLYAICAKVWHNWSQCYQLTQYTESTFRKLKIPKTFMECNHEAKHFLSSFFCDFRVSWVHRHTFRPFIYESLCWMCCILMSALRVMHKIKTTNPFFSIWRVDYNFHCALKGNSCTLCQDLRTTNHWCSIFLRHPCRFNNKTTWEDYYNTKTK